MKKYILIIAVLFCTSASAQIASLSEGFTYTLINSTYNLYEVATYCEP